MSHTSRHHAASEAHSDSSDEENNGNYVHRNLFAVPAVQPFNNGDASLIPSALHSPTQSCVELNCRSAVFSCHASLGGGTGDGDSGPEMTAAAAAPGEPQRTAEAGSDTNVEPVVSSSAPVVVNPKPAIIGYFGMMFGACVVVFYNQIFEDKGFVPYQIGILVATVPLMNMTLLPALSYLADKYRCETPMVLASIVISSSAMVGYTMAKVHFLVITFFLIMAGARIVMNPLMDQRTLMMFPREGRSSAWSYVRSYGAYGWGLGSLMASILYSYTQSWVPVAVQFFVGHWALAYCVIVVKPYERMEKVPVRFREVLHLLGSNKRVMLFLFASTMMGTGYSFIDTFLFVFLHELGGSKFLMGLTVVLTVSTEIPLFQISKRLHRMFTERHMMTIAMSVWTFRVVCYSMLKKPWWVLLIEPLHGVTFAFMWLPSVHLIARAFPPKLSSSATGVLFTFTSGVGPMIGNLVAGTLYTLVGPRKMFLCAATAMGSSLVLYLTLDYLLERRGVPLVCDYGDAEVTVVEDTGSSQHDGKAVEEGENDTVRKGDSQAKCGENDERTPRHARQRYQDADNGGRQRALDVVETELPV